MKNKNKPENERPEFPLDELYVYQNEKGENVFESTDFFTYSTPICDHCGKNANHCGEIGLHFSIFRDRMSDPNPNNPGIVLLGTLERISILCDDCWSDMIDTVGEYMRERKYAKIKQVKYRTIEAKKRR